LISEKHLVGADILLTDARPEALQKDILGDFGWGGEVF